MKKRKYEAGEGTLYLTDKQAIERYQLSRETIERLAAECGAALKIGRNKRYIAQKLDAYINSFEA